MRSALRSAIAVIGATLLGMFVIAGIEYIAVLAFPPAAGLDPRDRADLARIVSDAPPGARALVLAAWTIGAFVGGYAAGRLAPRANSLHARIVVAIILSGTVYNLAQFSQPAWMWVAGVAGVLIGGYGGITTAARTTPVTDHAV